MSEIDEIDEIELEGEIMYLEEQIEEARSRQQTAGDDEAADIEGEIMYLQEQILEAKSLLKKLRE